MNYQKLISNIFGSCESHARYYYYSLPSQSHPLILSLVSLPVVWMPLPPPMVLPFVAQICPNLLAFAADRDG
jgi:hypothetical protein